MSKKNLRKKLLNLREEKFRFLNIKYSSIKSIIKKSNLQRINTIGAYYPINYEIDCLEILKKIEKIGYNICLPVTKKKFEMDFFKWSFNDPLKIGNMGVPEPHKNKKIRALACYKSQDKRTYMKANFVESLARVRGVSVGVEFAEAFTLVRGVQR